MLLFFMNLIIRISAFPDCVNNELSGIRGLLSKSIFWPTRGLILNATVWQCSWSSGDVAGYPVSTLILTVPQLIQSSPDGQVQTVFEIDTTATLGANPRGQ